MKDVNENTLHSKSFENETKIVAKQLKDHHNLEMMEMLINQYKHQYQLKRRSQYSTQIYFDFGNLLMNCGVEPDLL